MGNVVRRTLPVRLQTKGCTDVSSAGDARVASLLTRPVRVMVRETIRRRRPPGYASMPSPPPQPSMPTPHSGSAARWAADPLLDSKYGIYGFRG
jgi:hypothetical protein